MKGRKSNGNSKKNSLEPASKKQKVGIDMSHIPLSLRSEGYTSDTAEEGNNTATTTTTTTTTSSTTALQVPDYLLCPVCKELFINPEMFGCGHTICKLCMLAKNQCPVCKGTDSRNPIPNYVVSQLIESQYPEKKQQRQKELDDIVALKSKISQYVLSSRYDSLTKAMEDYMMERRFVDYRELVEFLRSPKVVQSIKSPVSEAEVKYFLSQQITEQRTQFDRPSNYACIGEYVVYVTEISSLLAWIEILKQHVRSSHRSSRSKQKKTQPPPPPDKEVADGIKMLPLLLLCLSRPSTTYAVYQRVAQLYDATIGKELPLDSWKNQPSFWVKDVNLGDVRQVFEYRCSCGQTHGRTTPFTSDDEYYSDSDF